MSQLSRTGLIGARTDALDEAGGELGPSALDLLDRLWRIFTSMRTALLLMLALAVLGLIGTVLIQAPAGIQSDEAAYAAWLDALRPKYGGWVPIIDRLGLFAVFQSIWFKTVLVGLTTSILSCSVNRFRGLWKTAIHPRTRMGDAFYERAPHGSTIESTVESDDAVGLVRGV
ncbi:MAG TPA: cytochrome c biogenesis protein ResB, partial [Candidatus Limnocylindrales bacterium]